MHFRDKFESSILQDRICRNINESCVKERKTLYLYIVFCKNIKIYAFNMLIVLDFLNLSCSINTLSFYFRLLSFFFGTSLRAI